MEPDERILKEKPVVANIGLRHFYESLNLQGVRVVHVEWRPSPKLEKELKDILDKLL